MKRYVRSVRRSGLVLATALLLMASWAPDLQASYAYGYAEQTISSLTISPAITAASAVTSLSFAAATLNGSGPSSSNALDAPQVFIGSSPAPENFFSRYAPGTPPAGPDGNFTRGDSLIAQLTGPNNSASVVSESYLNTNTPTSEAASSSVTASLAFTTGTTGALTISYNFANDIYTYATGTGASTAHFGFDITIKDLAGNVVFDSVTTNTNISLAAPPNGMELINSGMNSVTTTSLTANTQYSIIFAITSGSSAVVSVPEPSSVVLMGLGGVAALAVFRRKRAKA
jgi:hypothetical protein